MRRVVLIVCKNQGAFMTYHYCTTELSDKILTVTINRPDAMNALHPDANAELAQVFDDFAADPDQWVAIITGAGERAFSAGNDLKFQAMGGKMSVPDSGFAGLTSRYDLNKPVIAAVNGVAMGGGFEIALACDLIIAADTAVFALPEPKVGLAALAGGLHRLPRQIGMKHAMGMILTEGATLGFVNEVVPAAGLMAAARKWAEMITSCAPSSVRASKEASYKGMDEATLEAAYKGQYKYDAVRAMFASPNLIEGPMAFAQKRAPKWVG
jgi:enoyl-CoA hydratase/carnithine racemase